MEPSQFARELKAHLEQFHPTSPTTKYRGSGFRVVEDAPETPEDVKGPVVITGVPLEGLTVKYQHLSEGAVDPAEMAKEAARVIGAAGGGAVGGAAVGAAIGKVVLGGTLARIGVASAGAAIGVPVLAPVAAVSGAVATAAYVAYKKGRNRKGESHLMERLIEHMEMFNPVGEWPKVEVSVSVSSLGLAALWQPNLSQS